MTSKMYGAYTEVQDVFHTFEDAVAFLQEHPGTVGKTVSAVSLIQSRGSQGILGVPVSGVSDDPYQAFVVKVAHATPAGVFKIEYLIEFTGVVEDGEVGEGSVGVGFGHEEDSVESDEGNQQPGEDSEGPGGSVIDGGDEAE